MSCETSYENLQAYLDDQLGAEERRLLAEHVVGCEDCRSVLDGLQGVSGALRLWVVPEPTNVPSARAILERAGATRPWWRSPQRLGAAAAVLLVAGFVGLFVLPQYRDQARKASPGIAQQAPASRHDAAPAEAPRADSAPSTEPRAVDEIAPAEEKSAAEPDALDAPKAEQQEVGANEQAAEAVGGEDQPSTAEGRDAKDVEADRVAAGVIAPAPPPPPATAKPTEARQEEAAANAAMAPAAPSAGAKEAGSGGRAQATSQRADMRIETSDIAGAERRIAAIASGVGGVYQSNLREGASSGTVVLSVPPDRFDAALQQLRQVGRVRSLSSTFENEGASSDDATTRRSARARKSVRRAATIVITLSEQ
jgi:hypothetical protein